MKLYRHMNRKEVVSEEDAVDYAMDHLGITITPKGKGGAYTLEQMEFICEFTEWYFSGEWVEEEEEEFVEAEPVYELEMIDRIYQDNLERKWGI